MRRLSRSRPAPLGVLALAGALLAGGLAGCTPEPAPAPETLSASRAGGVYLEAVCPVNAAWDAADVELDRLRIAVARGDGTKADTAPFARAMERVAEASGDAERELDPERRAWPDGAEDAVESVRDTLRADRKQALDVAKLDAEDAVARTWKGAEATGRAAEEARAALGLPADPVAACAQWEEQREKQKQKQDQKQKQKQDREQEQDQKQKQDRDQER